jgi:hypothetical protein
MHKTIIATLAFLTVSSQSNAQHVRILTPTDDICGAYVTSILKRDQAKIFNFGGWYLDYLSRLAQGLNIDFCVVRHQVN